MLNLIGYMTFNESMVKDSMGRRTQWMVKDSMDGEGINGWKGRRTQWMVQDSISFISSSCGAHMHCIFHGSQSKQDISIFCKRPYIYGALKKLNLPACEAIIGPSRLLRIPMALACKRINIGCCMQDLLHGSGCSSLLPEVAYKLTPASECYVLWEFR